MPAGAVYTDKILGEIEAYHNAGFTLQQIADQCKISKSGVKYVVDNIGKQRTAHCGGKRKLSDRDVRKIQRDASNKQTSASQILREGGYDVSVRTIQSVLHNCEYLHHEKMLKKPLISAPNKAGRLQYARDHQTWTKEREEVFWSDEKKWNLDGPDGWAYYWHDLRKEKLIFSKRQQGGGGIMVWGRFGFLDKGPVVKVEGSIDSKAYQKVLAQHCLPCLERCSGENAIFMQDNAKVHTSDSTMQFLEDKGVNLLGHPSNSPDLNPMENVWGNLARTVYAGKPPYANKTALWTAIQDAWAAMTMTELKDMINSMSARMGAVLEAQGGFTKY